ncbi:MAG: PAS domain S-box protein [Deltaproteobacteria bacterium]|nr:PAS domain S-box protein [Deltaproteobacteria bacterium]
MKFRSITFISLILMVVLLWGGVIDYHCRRVDAMLTAWTNLEMEIVRQSVRIAEEWLRHRTQSEGVEMETAEREILTKFIQPIRLLATGDAWIYNKDHVVFDESSDFPDIYRGKTIRQIFDMQYEKGAYHYSDLCEGVENATDGTGWYVWLPEKGREFVVWTSVRIGEDTWTIGLSTPEPEILDHLGINVQFRREILAVGIITVLFSAVSFLTFRQQRKDQACLIMLERTVNDRTASLVEANTALDTKIKDLILAEQALKEVRDGLEMRVKERTLELENANIHLNEEIVIRSETERALKESREKYEALFNNAQVGLYRSRISDGKILECNCKLAQLLGYDDKQELLDVYRTAEHYVDPGVRELFLSLLQRDRQLENFEARLTVRDGSIRWFRYSGKIFPETGVIEGVLTEITDKKQAEEQLQKSRLMLQAVFDGISEPLIMLDRRYCIKMLNQAALAYYQIEDSEEVIGRPCYEGLAASSEICEGCHISCAVLNRRKKIFDKNSLIYPGKIMQVVIYPLCHEKKSDVGGAIIRLCDVTEARKTEEQLLRANRLSSLAQLSAGIAHEIRNPLSSISLFTDILCDAGKFVRTEQEYEILREIKDNIHRISGIIKKVLDFARSPHEVKFATDINGIITDTLLFWDLKAQKSNVHLVVKLQENLPPMFGDELQLQQVFHNLVINALEAMENGGVLTLATTAGISSLIKYRQALIITVSDTGSGILDEDIENIFNPFFTTKRTGTGLGLAIAHKIIETHGGMISVKSRLGEGTTFSLEFPVYRGVDV